MSDKQFPEGFIFHLPHPKQPEFVKGRAAIKKQEFIQWLQSQPGDWVNLQFNESKSGKGYAQVHEWKKNENTI